MKKELVGGLLRVLPKNHVSYWIGNLMHAHLPGPLGSASVKWFVDRYKINMSEAEKPLSEYPTIGALFTRNLKSGARPLQNGVLHPVDGKITSWGSINKGTLLQAKDKNYFVAEFIDSEEWAELFEGGKFFTYYLCPTDYHQIHAPVSGEVVEARYIPGKLWPVNDWSVDSIDNLFGINERIVTFIKTDKGTVALVMVGATNVGKMTVAYDETLVSNQLDTKEPVVKKYSPGTKIKAGDKLGVFHMGSTVIMLYPQGYMELSKADPSGPVRMGETLGI